MRIIISASDPRRCYSFTVSRLNRTLESVARAQSVTVIFTRRVAEIEDNTLTSHQKHSRCAVSRSNSRLCLRMGAPITTVSIRIQLFPHPCNRRVVCCYELDLGWGRRRRRNENKNDNGKTGKIYVRAKWPITPAFVSGFSSMKR